MTAHTSQPDPISHLVSRLNGLCANDITLILQGKRSLEMIGVFAKALQLFKENRLAGVTEATGGRENLSETIATAPGPIEESRLRRQFYRRFNARHPNGIPLAVLNPSSPLREALARRPRLQLVSDVVVYDQADLAGIIGDLAAKDLEQLLLPHGLRLGMADDEMTEAFGENF